jgi:hypothetical protein
LLDYEPALLDVEIAEDDFERYERDLGYMKAGYRTAHLAGRVLPTP